MEGTGTSGGAGLLDGLEVAIVGEARALRFAGRCLRDFGASVHALPEEEASSADALWIGPFERLREGASVGLLLTERGSRDHGVDAEARVTYCGSSSRAENAGEMLDERMLAAVSATAIAIGEPSRPPLPLPEGCLDALVGTHLAASGLAALLGFTRESEVAGADVVTWAIATNLHLYLPYGLPWFRSGRRASGSGSCYPYSIFDAADGPYCLIGRSDRDWRALLRAMGDPAWAQGARFADPRMLGRKYPEEADVFVSEWVGNRTRDELTTLLVEHSFPCAPVLRPEEVLDLPYVADRWNATEHGGTQVKVPGVPTEARLASSQAAHGPLSDTVVLDLSWVWSGPAVSVALRDLGATVIKVESATRPDGSRLRGIPEGVRVSIDDPARLEAVPYFHALNRGKLSVSLDLKTEEGRAMLQRLADRADVIVENLSAGVMSRWGIAPEDVLERNPGCVFLSMRGYRDHPATAGLRAYAPALSSAAGIEALVGYPGERPTGAMTIAFSDAMAASQGLLTSLAGLRCRMSSGSGSALAMSQFETAMLANGHNIVSSQIGEPPAIQPLDEADPIAGAEDLVGSPWISPDLLGTFKTRLLGHVPVARLPWRQDGSMPALSGPAPTLGANTDAVLRSLLDLDRARLEELRATGVLQ